MPNPVDTPTLIAGIAAARRTVYSVAYGAANLGLCDMVDPTKSKLNFDKIMTGSTGGSNKLGDRFTGIDGVVTVQLRQLSQAQYRALAPWSAAAGPIALMPPLNADMYQFSQPLVLHPLDMADTTEDLNFSNAVPTSLPLVKRDGKTDDVLEVEFAYYPNRTTITAGSLNISSGTIGS